MKIIFQIFFLVELEEFFWIEKSNRNIIVIEIALFVINSGISSHSTLPKTLYRIIAYKNEIMKINFGNLPDVRMKVRNWELSVSE